MTQLLEKLFKWLFLASLLVFAATYLTKDRMPEPGFYDLTSINDPLQQATRRQPFMTEVNGQQYRIEPRFDYTLEGVVVSYNDADAITDITHHRKWQDFLNVRDLCVIWGNNITNGVYRQMDFRNDSWTCWASWPDAETGSRFAMTQLSNNHLLADDAAVKRRLMSAAPGDQVRFKGVLASYANPANGFQRGTSTVRTDTGNGACETVYLEDFAIIKQANPGMRSLYRAAKWLAILSLLGFIVMFTVAPVARPKVR
jgi:hypothetical protein